MNKRRGKKFNGKIRPNKARGKIHSDTMFSSVDAKRIYKLYMETDLTCRELGDVFGCSRGTISTIAHGGYRTSDGLPYLEG